MQTKWNPSSMEASPLWNPQRQSVEKPHIISLLRSKSSRPQNWNCTIFPRFFIRSWLDLIIPLPVMHHGSAFALDVWTPLWPVIIILQFFFSATWLGQHGYKCCSPTVSLCIIDLIQVPPASASGSGHQSAHQENLRLPAKDSFTCGRPLRAADAFWRCATSADTLIKQCHHIFVWLIPVYKRPITPVSHPDLSSPLTL